MMNDEQFQSILGEIRERLEVMIVAVCTSLVLDPAVMNTELATLIEDISTHLDTPEPISDVSMEFLAIIGHLGGIFDMMLRERTIFETSSSD